MIKKRMYQFGDEAQINELYKLVASIDRSKKKYLWEWVNTWNGQGSIYLAFEKNEGTYEKLIMQYSLIPTPFSLWGRSYLAGKTENCMSHPDIRGKGLYFPHEKQSFEDAKKRFPIFFTTAGEAGKGAAGAVRRKLGYQAIDTWIQYIFIIDPQYAKHQVLSKLKKHSFLPHFIADIVSFLTSYLVLPLFRSKSLKGCKYKSAFFDIKNAPIDEIEKMWNRNKKYYGITVDRKKSYLEWRINQNPYYSHRYLVLYSNQKIVGYLIFHQTSENAFRIIDILSEKINTSAFIYMLNQIILLAKKEKIGAILCGALRENKILSSVFTKSGFLSNTIFSIKKYLAKDRSSKPFHIYATPDIPNHELIYKPENLYITELVKEGR